MPTDTTQPQSIDLPAPTLAGEARIDPARDVNITTLTEYQEILEAVK